MQKKATENKKNVLWYDSPATDWNEALPLGNGRLGAMVYSKPQQEIISLNEDTLWSGYPKDNSIPNASDTYKKAVELLAEDKGFEAHALVESQFLGARTQSYLPLGDLLLTFEGVEKYDNYYRELDLNTAMLSSQYTVKDTTISSKVFTSAPAQALFISYTADNPVMNLSIRFTSQLQHTIFTKERALYLEGLAPSNVVPNYMNDDNPVTYSAVDEEKGMQFLSIVDVFETDGVVTISDDSLSITMASTITLRLVARTSFAGYDKQPYTQGADYHRLCVTDQQKSDNKSIGSLVEEHISDYARYFSRMDFALDGVSKEGLPTNQRLIDIIDTPYDAGLFNLGFQYGRYLLISCSRPGTQAANLQGIWNHILRAPWSSNYTVNINTEMNYWPAELCNLSEMHEPLFALLEKISRTGVKTARDYYDASGFVSHHNIDIWGHTVPVGGWAPGTATFGLWGVSGGWLCRHLYDHYLFTLDKDFLLTTAWPLLKECSAFFLDVLTPDNKGDLVFSPATSPENTFYHKGKGISIAQSVAMNQEIIRETLEYTLETAKILGLDSTLQTTITDTLPKLKNLQVGAKGQLMEWHEDYQEAEPEHRHLSHLYPLHPGHAVTPRTTPALAQACATTLHLRGDEATGWGIGWRMNLWARLKDGDHALKLLERQLHYSSSNNIDYKNQGGTLHNLLGTHPPFQIDGNFGMTSGIAELFLYTYKKYLELLPALPSAFGTGHMKGLCAHGGVVVDVYFKDSALDYAVLTPSVDTNLTIAWNNKETTRSLVANQAITITQAAFE